MSIWHWLIALVVLILIFGTRFHGSDGQDVENVVLHVKKLFHGAGKASKLIFWIKIAAGAILLMFVLIVAEKLALS